MRLIRVFPIAVFLAVVGCTSADTLRLDQTPRPQTSPRSVQLLGQEPTRPYKVIAIVSARSQTVFSKVQDRLLKEAAKLGGHAILLDTSSLTRVGGDETSAQQITGKVIVYTDSTGSN